MDESAFVDADFLDPQRLFRSDIDKFRLNAPIARSESLGSADLDASQYL